MVMIPTLLILALPLISFIAIGILRSRLPFAVTAVFGCASVFATFICSVVNLIGLQGSPLPYQATIWQWLRTGPIDITFGIYLDQLSLTMELMVTGVGFLILLYSVGYMENDPSFNRFFSFMHLFLFAMSLVVLADSFVFLLIGWAGVGLASFLLIGFWYQRPAAVLAARKAFVINVIGDCGLLIAIFVMITSFGSERFTDVLVASDVTVHLASVSIIALMLLVAAAAKSAQLPLHMWLPDAMEGPTPVSALIHAATMVTAGVYLVARSYTLFAASPIALTALAVMGGSSAIYAAAVALFQFDIKRILAYSTMSQLGYMFMAEAAGDNTAAIFHLVTHAFFKALLFMAVGGVIHALGGEQDIRRMGGLRHRLPLTFWSFMIGSLALVGIPPFAGFWSKDAVLAAILERAAGAGTNPWYCVLWGVAVATAFLTALYSFRMLVGVFFGDTVVKGQERFVHEVEGTMAVPMILLSLLCVIGGVIGIPSGNSIKSYLAPVFSRPPDVPSTQLLGFSMAITTIVVIAGIVVAWIWYRRRSAHTKARHPAPYVLLASGFHLDELGRMLIVYPLIATGLLAKKVVESVILEKGAYKFAWLIGQASQEARRSQTGYVRNYILIIFATAVVILAYIVTHGVAH